MKIVITGGAGFIGSQLGHALSSLGHDVLLIDDMSFGNEDNLTIDGKSFGKFIKEDVRKKDIGRYFEGAEAVFHFAGISSLPVCQENPGYAMDVNVSGTANVLETCRRMGIRRVFFSSTSALYENNASTPFRESDPVDPNLIYSISKLQGEELCKSFCVNYGMSITVMRFFNVYGAHQDFKRASPPLMGYITRELLLNRQPVLHSSGEQLRDYINIKDVISFFLSCMDKNFDSFDVFNVCSGKTYSVKQIYELFSKKLGKENMVPVYRDAALFWDKYAGLNQGHFPLKKSILEKEVNKFSLGSYEKAGTVFGWKPTVSLEHGVGEIVDFIRNNLSRYEKNLDH